jgi:hypothetical protein
MSRLLTAALRQPGIKAGREPPRAFQTPRRAQSASYNPPLFPQPASR